jgi:CheY-like chemotaxis protein
MASMEQRQLPRPHPRPLVLVVEDDEDTRAMYAYALPAMGFDVATADDAAKAHARASETRPDIIVADVASRERDGWTLLRALRRDPRTHDIPVVVITANAAPSERERAEREGCDALCLKSCPPDRLAFGLRAVLERRSHAGRETA